MIFLRFYLVMSMVVLISRRVSSKGCEKDGETWTCRDIYLETDKKLPISDIDLNVKNIRFENCVVPTIPTGVFNSFQNIIDVDLEGNEIETIIPGSLDELKLLNRLHLRSNKIREIKVKTFNSLVNVKELNLHYNQISQLGNGCFTNMSRLELLRIGWNKLEYISENVFSGLKSLKHLFLNSNRITRLAVGSFRDLPLLYQLDIEHNLLTNLEFGTISKCDSLSILTLSDNNFTHVREDIFYEFSNLHTLSLSNNNIPSLDVQKLLSYTPKLGKIALNNNSWSCNSLAYNIQILKVRNITITDNNTELVTNFQGIECTVPEEITTENVNILSRLENILNDRLLNITSLRGIQNTVLNSTVDYANSIFLKYFEEDFKNTAFFKHFNSSFYEEFSKNISDMFRSVQQFNLGFNNFTVDTDTRDTNRLHYLESKIFISICMIIVIVILLVTMIILCCILCYQRKKSISISHQDAFS